MSRVGFLQAKSNNGKSSEATAPPPAESLTNPFATATSSTLPRPSFMQGCHLPTAVLPIVAILCIMLLNPDNTEFDPPNQESVDFSKGSGRLREHANSVFFNPFKV